MCIQHIGIANLLVFPRALGRYKGSKTIFLPAIFDTLVEVTKSGALDEVIERALSRKPKYKPGAAKTAELHQLSKN